ncbi:hypothetical protein LUZ63_000437 [Rhynchospora breviuscula]|uniref:SWIM-type domain-containing protein n=1 Tax=Rhynchospora breviuscula TaxID=2022672 RepID=A0A9Q0CUX7_9POAL|nr:hypothetical protein LUZ63_000437 [Rhynchospora breviuscula]
MQLPVNSENEWRYVQEEGFQARRLHGLELHVDLLPATGDGLQANNTEEDEERNNEYNTSAQGWDSWEQPESSSPQPRQERTNNQYNMNAEGWDPWSQPESSRQARQEAEEEIEGDIDELDEAYDRGPGYQSNYATGEDFTDEEAEFREAQDFEGEGFANHEYYITGRTDNYHPVRQFSDISEYRNSIPQPSQPEHSGPLAEGNIFMSKEQLKQACSKYAVENNVQHKASKSSTILYVLDCKVPTCKWHLYARTEKEGIFWKIIKNEEEHTCVRRVGDFTHDNLTAAVIANSIRNAVKRDLGISIDDVKSILEKEYPNVKPTYNKLWRGREKAIEQLFGSWEGSYNKLPSILLAIQKTTPGTQIKWLTESVGDPNRAMFKAAAWAYGPCIAAVPYLRPVISIDASFLSGRYKGTLLAACGYDPEQRLLPLAFAIVEKENEQCWGWFMNFVRRQVIGEGKKFCVVSDRHWGIRNTFKQPQYGWQEDANPSYAVHRYCMQHICENVFKASDKDTTLPDKFRKKLANKKKKRLFYKMWNELKTTNPKAIDYLIKYGKENEADDNEEWRPERWAQMYDGGYRWGIMTSNGSESLNSRYKAERRLPVVGLVEGTWYKTVKWFNERKQIALARQAEGERWPKEIQLKLMKHSLKAAAINVITVDIERGEFEAQVPFEKNDPGITWKYQVFLKRNYQPRDPQLPTRRAWCKCRKPQLTGIPCLHVVAVCGHCRWDVSDFVDERYSTENMLKIWSTGEFHCYEDEHEWPVYDGPLIYPDKRLINRGRRKKDRNWMWMDAMRKKNQANQRRRTRRDNNAHEPVSMEDVQSGRRTNPRRTTRPSARNRAQSSTGNRGEPSREPVQPGRNSVSIDPHTESRVSLGIEGVLMAHQVAGDHLTAQAVEEGGYEVGFYG